MSFRSISFALAALLALGSLATAEADAQNRSRAPLASLGGQSNLQSRTGQSVTVACGRLRSGGTSLNGSSPTSDLFRRCGEMVQTANDLTDNGGPTGMSLGLNTQQTNQALNALVHDEVPGEGVLAAQTLATQFRSISSRIIALHQGESGISLAGVHLRTHDGQYITGDQLLSEDAAAAAGAALGPKVGLFLNVRGGFGDFRGSDEETPFDFRNIGATAGADYRFSENLVGGLAFGYENTQADYDGNRGDLDRNAYAFSAFGSFMEGGFFADGLVGYAYNDIDLSRNIRYADIRRTADGNTHSSEFAATGATGYLWSQDALSFGPSLRLDYRRASVAPYSESGAFGLNLDVDRQVIDSLRTTLGGSLQYAISTGFGVVSPYARAGWVHEFLDDSRLIIAKYSADPTGTPLSVVTSDPDRDWLEAGVGVSTTFQGGWSGFLDYTGAFLNDLFREHQFTIGFRKEF